MKKEKLLDYGAELVGNALIAVSLCSFVLQADIAMSGFSGIALIIYRLFGMPIGTVTIVLNIPVAILCWKLIGKEFLLKSFRCMIISAIIIDGFGSYLPVYTGDRLIAALLTGAVGGTGYALIYMRHSSTGGADFVIMAIKAKRPHMKLSTVVFLFDTFVVVLGGIVMKNFEGAVYGMVVSFVNSAVVDRFMTGANTSRVALIVTNHARAVCDMIDTSTERGSTIIPATGGYTGAERSVVMVASNPREMYTIAQEAKSVDDDSFVIILNSSEVRGNGFKVI